MSDVMSAQQEKRLREAQRLIAEQLQEIANLSHEVNPQASEDAGLTRPMPPLFAEIEIEGLDEVWFWDGQDISVEQISAFVKMASDLKVAKDLS